LPGPNQLGSKRTATPALCWRAKHTHRNDDLITVVLRDPLSKANVVQQRKQCVATDTEADTP
jgi:hypothetical protein